MNPTPAAYVPVPVHVARQIGLQCAKSAVVIWSHDALHELMHITTWGETPEDKLQAACLGDVFAKAAGMDLVKQAVFEDFRNRPAAESTAIIERQAAEIKELRGLILDCAHVAAKTFRPWSICDAIDNDGKAYQSQHAADILARIRAEATKS